MQLLSQSSIDRANISGSEEATRSYELRQLNESFLPEIDKRIAAGSVTDVPGFEGVVGKLGELRRLADVQLLAAKSAYQQAAAEVSGLTAGIPNSRVNQ